MNLKNPSPNETCCLFIHDASINLIAFYINTYVKQKGKRYILTNSVGIPTFIGKYFLWAINHLSSYRAFLSIRLYMRNEYISQLMTVNIFGCISSHMSDLNIDRQGKTTVGLYIVLFSGCCNYQCV